jgi:hypothetical protein
VPGRSRIHQKLGDVFFAGVFARSQGYVYDLHSFLRLDAKAYQIEVSNAQVKVGLSFDDHTL